MYQFSDLKKEAIKMLGAGILVMTEDQIENAIHNVLEFIQIVKVDYTL